MKPRILSAARISFPLASAIAAMLAAPAAFGVGGPYYWDNNGATSGFGTAGGTWSSGGTVGGSTQGWNTNSTGTPAPSGTIITDNTDSLNFGTSSAGLAAGTGSITVSGTVNSGNMTFGTASGSIIFSGTLGTAKINLASPATINTGGKTITFSDVSLNGSSNLTYTGGGVLAIKASSSTLTGDLFVLNGTLRLFNPSTGSGNNALGGASGPKITLGNTTGSSPATLEVNNSITVANAIDIRAGSSGLKTLGLGSAIGAIYSGAITASDNLTVLNDVAGTGGSVSVNGTGSSIAAGKTVTWSHLTSGAMNDTGTWSGGGSFSYSGTGNSGDITVAGANKTYSGGATLGTMNSTGNLVVNASSTGPANAPTSGPFGTGTLTIGATKMRAKTSDKTIANPITFSGNPTFDTDATETSLIFSGNADLGAATRTLTVSTGTTVAGKLVNFSGAISSATAGVGITKAGAGTLTLSGANTYTGNTTVTGGTLNISGVYTGDAASSSLLYGTTAANTVVNVSNDMTLMTTQGSNLAGSSTAYNQTAGTVNVSPTSSTNNFVTANGYGFFNLTGGTYKVNANRFAISAQNATLPTGVVYVGGSGTLDLASTTTTIIAYTGSGTLTVGTGGTVQRNGAPSQLWLTTNAGSAGTINLAGGTMDTGTAANAAIRVGNNTAGPQTGTINLAKGTLTMGQTIVGQVTGTGTNLYANYTGGTLKASATLAAVLPVSSSAITVTSTAYGPIDNPGTAEDFTGGLTIDTNGFSVTHGAAILGATGNGVKQSNLTITGGSGYIGAPMVTFTGGTGTPASGYAVISGGAVTGIVITSPGNYSVDPTGVTLTGGGGTGASVALSALTANPTDSGLSKTNTGTLTLTNTNTYAGPTTVNGGTLTLSGTGSINSSSGITINGSGAKFLQNSSTASTPGITLSQGTLTGSGTVGAVSVADTATAILSNNDGVAGASLTTGALTFNGAATVNTYSASTSAAIAASALSSNAAGTVTINASSPVWADGATYDLISYGGGSIGGAGFGQFALGTVTGLAARQTASALGNSGTAITISITGDTPYWTGNGDGKWNLSSTNNWSLLSNNNPAVFLATDNVLFNDNATGAGPILVDIDLANVAPTSTTFNNSTKDYVLDSSGGFGISSGSLTKSGTGKLTIKNVNTYTGSTTINGGMLVIDDGSIASSSNIVNNATLEYKLNANARTYANVISGSGSLIKSGTNTLTLSGNNTFSGGITVQAGTVGLTGSTAAGTGTITLSNGGTATSTVQFNSAVTYSNPITVASGSTSTNTVLGNASGALVLNGAVTINTGTTLTVNNSGTSSIDIGTGLISGDGSIVTTGTSTASFVFRGASTYTGGTTLGGSGVHVPAISTNGPAGSPTDGVFGTGTLNIGNTSIRSTTGADTTIGNTLTLSADFTGATITSEKSLILSGPATLTGTRTITSNIGSTVAGKSLTLSGSIGDGGNAYGITKAGTGTLVLSGANTYSGATTLNTGTLTLGNAAALGTGTLTINGGNLDSSVASLVNSGNNVQAWNGDFTFTGTQSLDLGIGAVTMSANRAVTVTANTLTVGGSIGGGAVSLTKSGAGTLKLTGANTYSGPTSVTAGTLQFNSSAALGDGSATNNITLGAATLRSISGTNDLGTNRTITLSGNATVRADADTLTLSGDIANGANSLALLGPGNIVVTGVIGSGATPTGALTIGSTAVAANVTLGGNNLFTGNVSLPATNSQPFSVLTLTHSGALGVGPKTVSATGGGEIHLQNNITLPTGINFTTSGNAQQNSVVTNRAVIYNDSGNNTINGNISMASGNANTIIASDSGLLTINGNLSAINTLRSLVLRGNGNGLISGVISNGTTVNLPVLKDAGTGTWTLNGVNTYTGPTTVNVGTLALGASGSIATSSAVNLGAAGTLDTSAQTTFAVPGTQTVAITIDPTGSGASGRIVAAGLDITNAVVTLNPTATLDDPVYVLATYTGLTGATFAAPLPTVPSGYTLNYAYEGNKIALVQSAGFSSWITGTFANGTVPSGQQGPNDDPDKDGIPNLVEYAIASQDPTVSNSTVGTFNGTSLSFSKRQPLATDLTYAIQESTDVGQLDTWAEVSGVNYTNNSTTISYTFTPGTPAKDFYRLNVNQNP